jgi:hypothetical protein
VTTPMDTSKGLFDAAKTPQQCISLYHSDADRKRKNLQNMPGVHMRAGYYWCNDCADALYGPATYMGIGQRQNFPSFTVTGPQGQTWTQPAGQEAWKETATKAGYELLRRAIDTLKAPAVCPVEA